MSTCRRPVLVLGAGINGAAIARELVLNGVPVRVVDRGDVASGTTAYSSRLIHGGLRYLEYGELALVRESLSERKRLLAQAPHLVRPLRLAIPVTRQWGGITQGAARMLFRRDLGPPRERGYWAVRSGLWIYDRMARDPALPRATVGKVGSPSLPDVSSRRFGHLCSFTDAQVAFPERLTLALLQDARQAAQELDVEFGVHTYCEARLVGSRVRVLETGGAGEPEPVDEFEPCAIVNATGAWVDDTLQRLQIPSTRLIGGTKGSHFVTWNRGLRERLRGQGVYAQAADGRPVFVLPFGDAALVGTTDIPCDAAPESVVASDEEIRYLLDLVNETFDGLHLAPDDVQMHCCGVRPLPLVPAGAPSAITRRHAIHQHQAVSLPTLSVIGGKLTTARALGEAVADKLLPLLGAPRTAYTRERVIPGGESCPPAIEEQQATCRRLSDELSLTPRQAQGMWALCGTRLTSIVAAAQPAAAGPGFQSVPGTDLPQAFVRWVIRNEWVKRLDDLVERRLMLLYDPRLSEATLRRLDALLVECGQADGPGGDRRVAACVRRLRDHFGKTVGPASAAGGN